MEQPQRQPALEPAVLNLVQSEFVAIRSEIGRLIDHQKDLQNLSLVSLGAVFAFIAAISDLDSTKNEVSLVLLLVPLLTLQFALTAADLSRRIIDLASYVEQLSGVANGLISRSDPALTAFPVWKWEEWKSALFQDDNQRSGSKSSRSKKHSPRFIVALDKSKWLSLLLPGVVSTVAYLRIENHPICDSWQVALFVLALAALVASAVLLVMYRSEALGVPGSASDDVSGKS